MKTNILIETIAAHAWPAETVKQYGNWLLRANRGITKRANSVLTIGTIPDKENWLTEIETFYEKQNIQPCFYITETTSELVEVQLQEANYVKTTELAILAIDTETLIRQIRENTELHAHMVDEVTSEWLDAFIALEGHDENNRSAFATIFQGIQLAKGFLAIYSEEKIIAVATIASELGWGYISNVVVSEHYRRRGIAHQLLLQLAVWARRYDTKRLFMQVLADNEPALQLYNKLGFTQLAKSHYQQKVT